MSGRRRPRKQGRGRQPRTLRTRLVVSAVTLIAVVCAVIGTVTTFALRSHLYDQLDGKLRETAGRAAARSNWGRGSERRPSERGKHREHRGHREQR